MSRPALQTKRWRWIASAAKLALGGQFSQSYVDLGLAWQNIDIARLTVAERQTILDLTQTRFAAGLENEASLEQAKALLAVSRMELHRAEAERDIRIHSVAALIGRGANIYGEIARPSAAVENALPLPEHLPADLLAHRPGRFWQPTLASVLRPCMAVTLPTPISIPISISPPRLASSRLVWRRCLQAIL